MSRKLTSYKDLLIIALTQGLPGIQEAWKAGKVSRKTVRRAIIEAKTQGMDTREWQDWATQHVGIRGVSGRRAADTGDTRIYRAQNTSNTLDFVRIPTGSIGIAKGGRVKAEFEDGRIVITPLS